MLAGRLYSPTTMLERGRWSIPCKWPVSAGTTGAVPRPVLIQEYRLEMADFHREAATAECAFQCVYAEPAGGVINTAGDDPPRARSEPPKVRRRRLREDPDRTDRNGQTSRQECPRSNSVQK